MITLMPLLFWGTIKPFSRVVVAFFSPLPWHEFPGSPRPCQRPALFSGWLLLVATLRGVQWHFTVVSGHFLISVENHLSGSFAHFQLFSN
jgi:hypothetical protein